MSKGEFANKRLLCAILGVLIGIFIIGILLLGLLIADNVIAFNLVKELGPEINNLITNLGLQLDAVATTIQNISKSLPKE